MLWRNPREPPSTLAAIVTSHDWLDSLSGLIGVVERNRADVVVEHVSLNNAMEKVTANKPEFAINSRSSATNVVPRCHQCSGEGLDQCAGDR